MTHKDDLFLRIRARHGHYCAMSTLGGMLGRAALSSLGCRAGELAAVYRMDTCATDGIEVATGCRPEVKAEGRHRLELRNGDGRGVAAELTAAGLSRAADCRRRLDAGEEADVVLAELRTASVHELITVTPLVGTEHDA